MYCSPRVSCMLPILFQDIPSPTLADMIVSKPLLSLFAAEGSFSILAI